MTVKQGLLFPIQDTIIFCDGEVMPIIETNYFEENGIETSGVMKEALCLNICKNCGYPTEQDRCDRILEIKRK